MKAKDLTKYFATVKLSDGRIQVMNNNWFLAKDEDAAIKRAEQLFEGMEIIDIKEHK